jgi:predicted lipid-binding transport protein (Tim44 family)
VGDLDDIRQFTTPEMFAHLKVDMDERGSSAQKTEVVSVQAQVLAVDESVARYIVSVRFTGVLRDGSGDADEPFNEIWHLTKTRHGNTGWVLCGIQQAA